MEQVILVGYWYDDFSDGGFQVIGVATDKKNAQDIKRAYEKDYRSKVSEYPFMFANGADTKPPKIIFKATPVNKAKFVCEGDL